MSNPFPLSASDQDAFINDVGVGTLYAMPDWGGIVVWRNRAILAYQKPNGDFALTDISGGIPDAGVPGGMIPATSLVKNMPTQQTSAFGVFVYSLPANFLQVAREDALATTTAIGETIQPLIPALSLTAILVVGVLIYMYAPRPR